MRKSFYVLGAILLSCELLFTGCPGQIPEVDDPQNNATAGTTGGSGSSSSGIKFLENETQLPGETYATVSVYNPTNSKVYIIAEVASNRSAREANNNNKTINGEIPAKTKKHVTLGNKHAYFFCNEDGKKIADMAQSDRGEWLPVYLELNEPIKKKQYMLLSQYKNKNLESFYRDYGNYMSYNLCLFEVIESTDRDAYHYQDENNDLYIRTYPSGNFWVDDLKMAYANIGTVITYDKPFTDNLSVLEGPWVAWGWSTLDPESGIWFCHRMMSYVLQVNNKADYANVIPTLKAQYINPTNQTVEIRRESDNSVISTYSPGEKKEIDLEILNNYYFCNENGTKIDNLQWYNGAWVPLHLESNELIEGKEYVVLDENRGMNFLYSETDSETGIKYYELCLYEKVERTDKDAYQIHQNNNDIYIRSYPSAVYIVDSFRMAQVIFGTTITYNNTFDNNLTEVYSPWSSWGWNTKDTDNNIWYAHRAVFYTMHVKDTSSYDGQIPKTKASYYNPTSQAITIYKADDDQVFTTVNPSEAKDIDFECFTDYYFIDSKGIKAYIFLDGKNPTSSPYTMYVDYPEDDKNYICLSQEKTAEITNYDNYYCLTLFEILDADTVQEKENPYYYYYPTSTGTDAYHYTENGADLWIRSYPAELIWIYPGQNFAENLAGTIRKYSEFKQAIDNAGFVLQETNEYNNFAGGWSNSISSDGENWLSYCHYIPKKNYNKY